MMSPNMTMFCLLVAVMVLIHPSMGTSVKGLHTAWGSSTDSIWVSWYVEKAQSGSQVNTRCEYESVGGTETVKATRKEYHDTCDAPQCTVFEGAIYSALIKNTFENKKPTVRYSCGDDTFGMSPQRDVRFGPLHKQSTNFIMTADVGSYDASKAVRDLMINNPLIDDIEFMLMVGDIAYAAGNASLWDTFDSMWEPLSDTIPTIMSPGNHDGDWLFGNNYNLPASAWVGGGESGTAYASRYPGPGPAVTWPSQHSNVPTYESTSFWWSRTDASGRIKIIATSGVHPFESGTPQYKWIESELSIAAAQRDASKGDENGVKWIIVSNHFPMYCTIDDCFCGNYTNAARQQRCEPGKNGTVIPGILEMNAVRIKDALEPLILKYKIDLFLSGHEHAYERTLPVGNFVVPSGITKETTVFINPPSPVHVMVGTGGGGPDTKWRPSKSFPWTTIRSDLPDDDTYPFGYLLLSEQHNSTHSNLTSIFYNTQPDMPHGKVRDSFSVIKTN
eukprot:TRINITY_DN3538_c0_g1_i1.p1 TRINITY_DN3538_c0_g1~~TRINITY_DN3538_c0_g1_i1.p1  ORF type:complete len:503 (+),score=97.07 TRINITY_DN3538_c0_g1_i1:37-1545(+)